MAQPPDLVLVITDQQRFDQVGYVNDGYYDTPNLDRLADRGVVFENAYSASTTCVPARIGLLTGLQHHRVPTQVNLLAFREGFWTIAHALRAAGYETTLIGKAHFYPMRSEHGFDTLRLVEHLNTYSPDDRQAGPPNHLDDYHDWLRLQGYDDWRMMTPEELATRQRASGSSSPFPYEARLHPTAWVEQETVSFLERRDPSRPLFLVVSFPHPHPPHDPPEPYASMFDPADAAVPSEGFEVNERLPAAYLDALTEPTEAFSPWHVGDERHLRQMLTLVRALIKQIDDSLGRILGRFDLTRSVVWYTSDHGDYAGHRGMLLKYPWIPFDDLARVPLVVPGAGVSPGRRTRELVQNCDFALTALDCAGIEAPPDVFETRSLRPLLEARERPDADRAVFCATGVMGWPMVRRGSLKYVWHPETGTHALFDLERDPAETLSVVDDPAYETARRELWSLLSQELERPVPDLPTFAATGVA